MDKELLPCQKALMLLFNIMPTKAGGINGLMLNAFKAQIPTIKKALETDKSLQFELDDMFIKARNELLNIYPINEKPDYKWLADKK